MTPVQDIVFISKYHTNEELKFVHNLVSGTLVNKDFRNMVSKDFRNIVNKDFRNIVWVFWWDV